MHGIIVERVSCLVHDLHDLHGVGVCFRDGTLAHWVTHSVPQGRPLELGLCYPPYSPCLLGCAAVVFTAVWCGISFVNTHLLSSPDPILAMASMD